MALSPWKRRSLFVVTLLAIAGVAHGHVVLYISPIGESSSFGAGPVYANTGGAVHTGTLRVWLDGNGEGGFYYRATSGTGAPILYCEVKFLGMPNGLPHFQFDGLDVFLSPRPSYMPSASTGDGLLVRLTGYANASGLLTEAVMLQNQSDPNGATVGTTLTTLYPEAPQLKIMAVVITDSGGGAGGGGGGGEGAWTEEDVDDLLEYVESLVLLMQGNNQLLQHIYLGLMDDDLETPVLRVIRDHLESMKDDVTEIRDILEEQFDWLKDAMETGPGYEHDEPDLPGSDPTADLRGTLTGLVGSPATRLPELGGEPITWELTLPRLDGGVFSQVIRVDGVGMRGSADYFGTALVYAPFVTRAISVVAVAACLFFSLWDSLLRPKG